MSPSPAAAAEELEVLCEDGPVLAVNKPAGLLTQGAPRGIPTLEARVRDWIKQRFHKPGNVYLGIPHRLDRPVSGVVVFSRNSKCAARLAEQFRERQVRKTYLACVAGTPQPAESTLHDWLLKDAERAHVAVVPAETPGAREAVLSYRTLEARFGRTLLQIELETGRMHQIRVQLASRGWPIVGDAAYGAAAALPGPAPTDPRAAPIALHASRLTILHPIRYDPLTITAPLPAAWHGLGFHAGGVS